MREYRSTAPSGLLLPPGVIQPFLLRYRRDDLHVMAFFHGHPEYEAVEAMIRKRDGGAYAIRAILTRHDQSQVDHINDGELFAEMRGARREMCFRPVDLRLQRDDLACHALLSFVSHAGEQVVLDLHTTGHPDARRGGLTDPGQHSATSSLPLMLRGASVLAGPRTMVTVDGAAYVVPVKVRTGAFVGHEGYYTEPHSMGVFRAGEVAVRRLRAPERIAVGAGWMFESEDRQFDYRIVACGDDGEVHIASDGGGETIFGRLCGDRLDITRIALPGQRQGQLEGQLKGDPGVADGLILRFDDAGHFSLAMEGTQDLVTGRFEQAQTANGADITLSPTQPAWARERAVRVTCRRDAEDFIFSTAIGRPWGWAGTRRRRCPTACGSPIGPISSGSRAPSISSLLPILRSTASRCVSKDEAQDA
jgi:hypothetical protein